MEQFQMPEEMKNLPTLKEFCKLMDRSKNSIFVYPRFGELLDRCCIRDAIKYYGNRRVFNFFDSGPGKMSVYICCRAA